MTDLGPCLLGWLPQKIMGHYMFLGKYPPTPPLSQHKHLLLT